MNALKKIKSSEYYIKYQNNSDKKICVFYYFYSIYCIYNFETFICFLIVLDNDKALEIKIKINYQNSCKNSFIVNVKHAKIT